MSTVRSGERGQTGSPTDDDGRKRHKILPQPPGSIDERLGFVIRGESSAGGRRPSVRSRTEEQRGNLLVPCHKLGDSVVFGHG